MKETHKEGCNSLRELKIAKEERTFINWEGFIIKEDGRRRINHGSIYWIFLVPVLLPLMLWISSLIIDKFGWIKGMFAISYPLLVLGFVIQSKKKINVLIGGIMTFIIGWFIFNMAGVII